MHAKQGFQWMSIRLMTLVWDVDFPTLAQKLVILRIADYSTDEGTSIFPSNATLARAAQCDERTVRRVTRALRSCGLLHLVREGGKGPQSTNHWWLNVPLLRALADGQCTLAGSSNELEIEGDPPVEIKADTVSSLDELSRTSEALRRTPASAKVDTGVHQSINNHHIEPSTRASARKNSDFEFGKGKARPSIEITRNDPSWRAWIEHLETSRRPELAEQAESAGKLTSSSRWPGDGAIARIGQFDYTARMVGSE
jgi:hypothetical protein